MRFLGRLAVLVLLALSLVFLFGYPVRWGEAALMTPRLSCSTP